MQVGDEFVVMVETTITANGKTIENPIIRVTKSGSGNPSFVYFIDNQTVGQPRHWYVGDGNGNVVVSDIDVVDSTTSTALATELTNQLTAAGYLSGSHTGTVNDVPDTYNRQIDIHIVNPSYDDLENESFIYLKGVVSGVTNPVLQLTSKGDNEFSVCLASGGYIWRYLGGLFTSVITAETLAELKLVLADMFKDAYGNDFIISDDTYVQSDISGALTEVTIIL